MFTRYILFALLLYFLYACNMPASNKIRPSENSFELEFSEANYDTIIPSYLNTHPFKKNDTTFLYRSTSKDYYNAVYFDTLNDKKYFKNFASMEWGEPFQNTLNQEFEHFEEKCGQRLHRKIIPKSIPRKWLPIETYQGEYYFYISAQFIGGQLISDTSLIWMGMEKSQQPLKSLVKKKKDEYEIRYSPFCSAVEKRIKIHIIDSRTNLAVWEFIEPSESTWYGLFAPSDSVKLFPVIANYCKYELRLEYKFEQPDYLKILQEHKAASQ